MDIKFFNVEHGFCATIVMDDNHTILVDCGYNYHKGFSPGMYLVKSHHTQVDCLILPSYSEHHLEGFSELLTQFVDNFFTPKILVANPSITSEKTVNTALNNLGINNVLKLFNQTKSGEQSFQHTIKFDDLRLTFFWNDSTETDNLDDLSLVTFLKYSDINIIFPGDLTTKGWQRLLNHPEFVEQLKQVNLFVASNHGQSVGYCADVFKYCHPQLVIISNDIDHTVSEEMIKRYASHAKGTAVDQANRQLLMTHRDGRINISRYLDRRLEVTTEPIYRN
jgi:beta-lactamase superfamily II metal-dependent hydrolase